MNFVTQNNKGRITGGRAGRGAEGAISIGTTPSALGNTTRTLETRGCKLSRDLSLLIVLNFILTIVSELHNTVPKNEFKTHVHRDYSTILVAML